VAALCRLVKPQAASHNSKPAVLAFDGDVYDGLQARTLKAADLDWAQQHLVILSGLYGVLRPLDRLQPYRLEMGTALATTRGKDLYAFWGDTHRRPPERAPGHAAKRRVVSTSPRSNTPAPRCGRRCARACRLRVRGLEGRPLQDHQLLRQARARLMARWAIEHRVDSPGKLAQFQADGYAFDAEASTPDRLVFRRRVAAD
jgi:cytoplasmic iron level regulating protein YaaA (DUF328/UPF0246 family)